MTAPHTVAKHTIAVPENLLPELHRLYRGLEMSAGIMRDPARTGRWAGAEKTAAAFARYAATAQSLHALVAASAARQSNDMEGEASNVG